MITVRISVRNLIEFILRSGDIDNRFGTFSEDAMQEGAKIHRRLQKMAGADYRAEVPLQLDFTVEDVCILVEGRADGVIENETIVTVDEIKTTYADVMRYKEPKPLHLAQAKFYAYIISKRKDLPSIKIRLTYVNIDTEETRYFNYTFLREELKEFTFGVINEYVKWARLEAEWKDIRNSSIKGLPFPFEYRKGQEKLVKQVYFTILHKRKLYLQAPTGVGKTIATLYPAVQALGQDKGNKIFYLTAKTITRTVAEDTFNVMRRDGLKIKNITLTAKEKICLTESHECNPEGCPYAKGHYDRVNDCVYEMVTTEEEITSEMVLKYAEKFKVCPFEMSLDASLFTDAIICDYNYAFDKRAKLKRYFEDETKAGDFIFLIDEAHNLVDRAREMFSATLIKEQFLYAKKLTEKELPGISKRIEKCNKEMLILRHQCGDFLINPLIGDFTNSLLRLYSAIEKFLKEERKPKEKTRELLMVSKEVKDGILELYFEIGHFLEMYELVDENYSVYCAYTEEENFYVKLFCVNPRKNLSECMSLARSSILFSATLLPIQYYKNLLAGEREDYEVYAESVFNSKKRGLFIATDVTSKYTRRNEKEFNKIAAYINEAVKSRPGNYMVFFPSYNFMEQVKKQFDLSFYNKDIEILMQSQGMKEDKRDAFLRRFEGNVNPDTVFKNIDAEIDIESDSDSEGNKPASLVGFCVMGGIFSEGIDLARESLIGAIIVGTGLPQVCLERNIMKDTFDSEEVDGYDYAYKYPGMNKVLQAAGRVIRTEEDVGTVLLLDERFLQPGYVRMFPKEWSNFKRVNLDFLISEMKDFWDENK